MTSGQVGTALDRGPLDMGGQGSFSGLSFDLSPAWELRLTMAAPPGIVVARPPGAFVSARLAP